MIDHISIGVSNLESSTRFYEVTLAPLGLAKLVTRSVSVGFGKRYPEFWIHARPEMVKVPPSNGSHVCFRTASETEVDAFHQAALGAGGRSDGAPGLRPHERVRYYAAFICDPDGHRIEVVTFPVGDAIAPH